MTYEEVLIGRSIFRT